MARDFTVEVMGDRELNRGLSRFADDIRDLSPAFEDISNSFIEMERRQFESQGAFGGVAWPPLSVHTIATKPPGLPMLVRTGKLRGSLTGGSGFIKQVAPLKMVIGTEILYASYHQKGTSKMPPRVLVKLPESEKVKWMKIIHQYSVKLIRRNGL